METMLEPMRDLFGEVIPEKKKPEPIVFIKSTSETLYVGNNGEWGYFTIVSEFGLLSVYSSFGTFAYCWPNDKGDRFKESLGGPGGYDYTLNKLCGDLKEKQVSKFGRMLLMPFLEKLEAEVRSDGADTAGQA